MPKPLPDETRSDYIARCVQVLKHEEPGKPTRECLGKCYGMWDSHKKKAKKQ